MIRCDGAEGRDVIGWSIAVVVGSAMTFVLEAVFLMLRICAAPFLTPSCHPISYVAAVAEALFASLVPL